MNDTTKLPVTVIVTTYDPSSGERYNLLYQTLRSFVDNLNYPNLEYIVTDDSAEVSSSMVDIVHDLLAEYPHKIFHTFRKGVGYAKNSALREAFKVSKICWLTEDDWWLSQRLELLPHVQVMLDNPSIGMCRFGYLGGTMSADYVDYGPFLTYWKLKPASGFYVYSGQCSLRSSVLYEKVGWHTEGCTAGEEEESYCWKYGQTENPPDIIWPANIPSVMNSGIFKNIGLGSSMNGVKPI